MQLRVLVALEKRKSIKIDDLLLHKWRSFAIRMAPSNASCKLSLTINLVTILHYHSHATMPSEENFIALNGRDFHTFVSIQHHMDEGKEK